MGLLTVDPERLLLLERAVERVVHGIDSCRYLTDSADVDLLLRRARDLADFQRATVRSAADSIDSMWNTNVVPTLALAEFVDDWGKHSIDWWMRPSTEVATRVDSALENLAPGEAGTFLDSIDSIEYVVHGTVDLETLESVWRDATDPTTTSPEDACRRIRRLLESVFDDRPWERGIARGPIDSVSRSRRNSLLRDMAARVVAPWQLHIMGVGDAGWSPDAGAHRLHQIAETQTGSHTLLRGLPGAVHRTLSQLPHDAEARLEVIDAVARSVGASLEIHRMSEIDRARHGANIDTWGTIIGTLADDGPFPVSLLVDAGAGWIRGYFDARDERIRVATIQSLSYREFVAAIAVVAVWTAAVSRSTGSGRDTTGAVNSRDLEIELRHTYDSIDNAAGRGQIVAQLSGR